MKFRLILFFCILGVLSFFYYDLLIPPKQEQFVSLAFSFLQGKLYFPSATFDAAIYRGHYYWPLGAFPAVLLMPFVYLFGGAMRQGYLLFFLNILNIFLMLRITKKLSANLTNSLIISFAILFSSAYLGIALTPSPWSLGQIVGFTLTLLALEAYFFNRSWLIIGICIALAYATRISLILTSVFFILNLLYSDFSAKIKTKKLALLIIPIIASIIVVGLYNYIRFNGFLETGYAKQYLEGPVAANRDFGLWSPVHIPTNLYYMFLKMPDPIFISGTQVMQFPYLSIDGLGLSIFLTSPVFIWVLFSNWEKQQVKFAAITCLIMLLALSGSFTSGGWQYGYRYAIDFYPLLFVMLLNFFKNEVSYKFLVISVCSFIFNLYFINALFFK